MKPDQPLLTPSAPLDTTRPPGEKPNGAAQGVPFRFSKKRLALAIAIAAISDLSGAFFTLAPPVVWALDLVTASCFLRCWAGIGCCCRDWSWKRSPAWRRFRFGC
jgi:hypothetical protein